MFAILLNSVQTAGDVEETLLSGLRSYGVEKIIHNDSLGALAPDEAGSNHEEVIILNSSPDLNNLTLRRLTLSSKRLPSRMTVWEDQSQRRFVAARVPWAAVNQSRLQHPEAPIEEVLRSLQQSDPSIASYTIQQFASTDALRLGGSWAKCIIRKYFTKHASGRGKNKLLDEINFYRTLPVALAPHYLELLYSREDETGVSFGLEYREDPNMRDLLMNFEIEPREAARLLRKVLEFEYREAFDKYRAPTPENYLKEFHYQRVWTRLAMCLEIDPGLSGLIHARRVIINGESFPNIPAMLYKLEQSPAAAVRLDPGSVSPHIHGDTHLENILYDREKDHFYLVDPRGYPVCDIFYDIGKLQHSYHGGYDLLHEGRHWVTWSVSPDGETAQVDFGFTAPALWDKYKELATLMGDVVEEVLGPREKDIELKVLFNEAMHFPSITPFHIHHGPTPNVTVPFYAVGVRTLAQVLRMLDLDVDSCLELRDEALQKLAARGNEPWKFGD
ncbi:hypothetical protein MMC15_005460 [Xylographa vitiligo]|nr:hypothetical protein [Xylographa vitiligo]